MDVPRRLQASQASSFSLSVAILDVLRLWIFGFAVEFIFTVLEHGFSVYVYSVLDSALFTLDGPKMAHQLSKCSQIWLSFDHLSH